MKRMIFPALLCCHTAFLQAQTVTDLRTNGNVLNTSDRIGSTNNEDVTFIANGQNHLVLKKNGNLKLVSFDNGQAGIVSNSANGIFSKTNFTGNLSDVLTGTGTFTPLNTLTGWTLSGTALSTSKRLDLKTSMSMTGYDASEGTRNEIWTLSNAFFLNSKPGLHYHTIINHNNNGNVGVGTDNPLAKFHLKGNALFEGEVKLDSVSMGGLEIKVKPGTVLPAIVTTAPSNAPRLNIIPMCIPAGTAKVISAVDGLYHAYSSSGAPGSLTMGYNGTAAFMQSYNTPLQLNYFCGNDVAICTGTAGGNVFLCNETSGGVGIATTYIPAGYQLAVKGKVMAEDLRVKLRSTWPDYVFDEVRALPTLPATEQYIRANHHLPGVPSAGEINAQGFDTGEMIRIQMEKIEELTLHIIELEKRIGELEKH